LSDENLDEFINLDGLGNIPVQAKSDAIRILLLEKFGGIWLDATLYVNLPLDEWLWDNLGQEFFAFSNPRKNFGRIVSSWFLAGRNDNYIINKWKIETLKYWENREEADQYFWFHNLFKEMYDKDEKFSLLWDRTNKIDCDVGTRQGPHFFAPYTDEILKSIASQEVPASPVFKLTWRVDLLKSPVIQELFKDDM